MLTTSLRQLRALCNVRGKQSLLADASEAAFLRLLRTTDAPKPALYKGTAACQQSRRLDNVNSCKSNRRERHEASRAVWFLAQGGRTAEGRTKVHPAGASPIETQLR